MKNTSTQPTDILLVDDYTPTRSEILQLISAEDDLEVIGEAASGDDAVRRASELNPDVVVMDIVMPKMNGIEATRAIRGSHPRVRILAVSNHTGRNLLRAALDAGATGYIRKDHAYEELIPAIRNVANGVMYIGSGIEN